MVLRDDDHYISDTLTMRLRSENLKRLRDIAAAAVGGPGNAHDVSVVHIAFLDDASNTVILTIRQLRVKMGRFTARSTKGMSRWNCR